MKVCVVELVLRTRLYFSICARAYVVCNRALKLTVNGVTDNQLRSGYRIFQKGEGGVAVRFRPDTKCVWGAA